eukprot:CAMPEP_0119173252 /NCGR_PEP_ID=MMETSP1315-20130426/32610_1 /TAXON_ID=676789 /ORGANISM="Prasinoderma singularis, Strain RCC927" /LENGTH=117 /DNA_ID=CAMNT_0007167183 /DNA_START=1 /DNA_END=351 /DNA_ORIENTATION=+
MQAKLFAALLAKDIDFFDRTDTAVVLDRVNRDVGEAVSCIVKQLLIGVVNATATFSVAAGYVVYTSPSMAKIIACSMPPSVILSLLMRTDLRKLITDAIEATGVASAFALEALSGVR